MKSITYEEAYERAKEGKIVIAAYEGDFENEAENILTLNDLSDYEGDKTVVFGYDEEAEIEAEAIFESLREEVKDYLHRLLVNENIPSW